jgi:hypothetical protein
MIGIRSDTHGFWYITIPLPWVMSWELPPPVIRRLLDGELSLDGDKLPCGRRQVRGMA